MEQGTGSESKPRGGCLLVLAGWLVAAAALEARHAAGRPVAPAPGVLARAAPDLTRATTRELRRVPGVGPQLALEIERTRWREGELVDLERVRGIGPVLAESIRAWLGARGAEIRTQGSPDQAPRAPPGE